MSTVIAYLISFIMQRIPYPTLLDMFQNPLHAHSCIRQQQTGSAYGGMGCYQRRLEAVETVPEYEGEIFGETPRGPCLADKASVDNEVRVRSNLK